ncbi:MAG: hypothetical protein EOO02_00065 [Chitinophagaceae bacterium]|nr:MAG: hypothetical protein EOO02_00065 [Chitinophagaceae bacterium]
MQDKELDQLFRAGLEGLEMEPSTKVWEGITGKHNAGKKKKLLPYLSIAATILVVVSAGILVISGQDKVITKQPVQNSVAKHTPVSKKNAVVITRPVLKVIKVDKSPKAERIAAMPEKKARTKAVKQEQIPEIKVEPIVQQQPVLVATVKTVRTLEPVVPDNDIALSQKTITPPPEAFKTTPVVMASVKLPDTGTEQTQPVKKKKINSFGGILNAIVAKLDKREDKFIQFNDADGENNITAINLGIVKIGKEQE